MPEQDALCKIDRYVERRRHQVGNPAMAIALTDRERTVHLGTYGATDPRGNTPVTPDTLFEIGSISKTFGAVVAMQAWEAGLIELHAPVTAYLPWFQVRSTYESPITIHHLLSHSAGLVYSADYSPDPRGVVWGLREMAVGFAPGEHYSCSEPGYQTLTLVLEEVYGKPYAEIVQAGILDPLDMAGSVSAITHAIRPRLPQGYRRLYDDRPPHVSHPTVPAAWLELNSADGAIASTAQDMTKFVRMLLNRGRGPRERILSEESLELMAREAVKGSQYGYGMYVFDQDGCRQIGHGGDMPGYEAYMRVDLDSGLGTVLLAAQPYPSGLWRQVYTFWRASSLGQELPELLPPADPTRVGNAQDYAGTYRAHGRSITFLAGRERLYLNQSGERVALEQRGDDRFYANHPRFDLFFLQFGRGGSKGDAPGPVVEVTYGSDWYVNDGYAGPTQFEYPPEWDAYAGHYRMHNPWLTNFRVIVRRGALFFVWPWGDENPLVPVDDGSFRVGEDAHSPERVRFDQIVDGKALRATLSGCNYYRFFTP